MRWRHSVAIITGASRGIGAAVARSASERGARVGLIARSKADLEAVLASCGGNGALVVADVSRSDEVHDAISALEGDLGPTDILVNNAGLGAHGSIAEIRLETFEHLMRVNYLGVVYAIKAVLPGMLQRRRGHILTIASIAGRVGAPLEGAYSASKFAVAGLSESLDAELARKGIHVSLINPGPVETDFFRVRGAPYQRSFPKFVQPEQVAARVIHAVEHNLAEQFVPRWLRVPVVIKVLAPRLYRKGIRFDYRKELR